jgi:pilus assembly protein Flp/PilA
MRRFLKDQSGSTAIEYALIAGFVAVAIVAVLGAVGTELVKPFEKVKNGFN